MLVWIRNVQSVCRCACTRYSKVVCMGVCTMVLSCDIRMVYIHLENYFDPGGLHT